MKINGFDIEKLERLINAKGSWRTLDFKNKKIIRNWNKRNGNVSEMKRQKTT